MEKEIRVPEISENVTSGTVVEVLVQPGEHVEVDDPVIEFETEKAVVEIPSPYRGRITRVLVEAGQELSVGDVVARIDTADEAGAEEARPKEKGEPDSGSEAKEEPPPEEADEPAGEEDSASGGGESPAPDADTGEAAESDLPQPPTETEDAGASASAPREEGGSDGERDADRPGPVPASPSVRRLARELGVDIRAVRPARAGDRISEADVRGFVKQALSSEKRPGREAAPRAGDAPGGLPDFSRWGEVEVQELSTVRRLTAESMAAAWQTVVHVTQFDRADVTDVLAFVQRNAERAADRGAKLTLTAVLAKVCAAALRRFPRFNASIDPERQQLILKKYVHIGIAVDTPRGLLVPVVRDADRKSILELAADIADLAGRAREKKIAPDEMEGGSFTISNQGGIGGTNFTPVVYWPQTAILGVSRTATEPVLEDGQWRPRQMLPLALSYDHRIVDGADAARFTGWIRECLEHPLTLQLD